MKSRQPAGHIHEQMGCEVHMHINHHPAVRLWTINLNGLNTPPPNWLELLDEEELLHCQRFRQEKDRLAYIAAHALLRCTLSRSLKIPQSSLIIAHDKRGKPFINMPESKPIGISLSHTAGMVAVVLGEAGNVGVDVEAVNQQLIHQDDLSAFGVSQKEAEDLASIAEPARSELFFDLWTTREAVAKADGRGLSLPFSLIQIDRSKNIATIHEDGNSPESHWRLWRKRPSPLHRLSVA
jgi:4'-phosphopantetheinyl transferase